MSKSNSFASDTVDAFTKLKSWRFRNREKLTIGSLNINSLPKKIDDIRTLTIDNLDILVIQETKLDDTFTNESIKIPGYIHQPFRKDRNLNGGGIVTYIREDIPSKLLDTAKLPSDIEGVFIELNLRKSKWLIFSSYLPPWQNKSYYFETLVKALDFYRPKYENIILLGDFNTKETEQVMEDFIFEQDLTNLVKFPTCYKNVNNPSSIDLILTNKPNCFQNTTGISTGLSDFHKMIVTSLKLTFSKNKPIERVYRDMKKFNRESFRNELTTELSKLDSEYESFEDTFMSVLNKHAPLKKKLLRGNEKPYVTKAMRKAIMKRSELATKYRRHPNIGYKHEMLSGVILL